MSKESNQRVRVGLKIRPLNEKEINEGAQDILKVKQNRKTVHCTVPSKQNTFNFDWAFDSNESQVQVYNDLSIPILDNLFEGINATILAYGQTGSGKTYTIGSAEMESNSEQCGITQRILVDIFKKIEQLQEQYSAETEMNKSKFNVDMELSYMEVYKEECFDLLSKNKQILQLRESQKSETIAENMTKVCFPSVSSDQTKGVKDVFKVLREATKNRSTNSTAMNAKSSRSHALFTLQLKITRPMCGEIVSMNSKLNIVDLAGSERMKKTGASGNVLKEGIAINQGLLVLGNVIEALARKSINTDDSASGSPHIPYRDSKITRLLKDSLGGNSVTILLACVSPADIHCEETVNTLRFASRAMDVVNKATANMKLEHDEEENSQKDAEIRQLKYELVTLQRMMQQIKPSQLLSQAGGNENNALLQSTHAPSEVETWNILQFAKLLHSTLVSCMNEDILLDEGEMESQMLSFLSLVKQLKSMNYHRLSCQQQKSVGGLEFQFNLGEAEIDMFMPVIMQLIEELDMLIKILNVSFHENDEDGVDHENIFSGNENIFDRNTVPISDSVSSSLSTSCRSSLSSNSESVASCESERSRNSVDMDDQLSDAAGAETANVIKEKMDSKQNRVCKINSFLSEFEKNISSLKTDIASLQKDKLSIFSSMKTVSKLDKAVTCNSAKDALSEGNRAVEAGSTTKPPSCSGSKSSVSSTAGSNRPGYMSSTTSSKVGFGSSTSIKASVSNRPTATLSVASNHTKPSSSSNTLTLQQKQQQERMKQELSAKSKILEEKLKELKQKEMEYNKTCQEKKKVVVEVEGLKNELLAVNEKRVVLQSKIKVDAKSHNEEKRRLLVAEQQSKKRERTLNNQFNKLEHAINSKERVWKMQLESKDREAKKLKDLIKKQENAREQRRIMGKTDLTNYNTRQHAVDIKSYMKHRLMQERLTYIYKEEIDLEMKLRAKSARQLHLMILRLKQEQPEGEELEEISMRIGQLEADIANRSTVIQHRQGFLANAASGTCTSEDGEEGKEADNIDKVCLNSADYKIAIKYMMEQHIAATKLNISQAKSLESKIKKQTNEIAKLKQKLKHQAASGAIVVEEETIEQDYVSDEEMDMQEEYSEFEESDTSMDSEEDNEDCSDDEYEPGKTPTKFNFNHRSKMRRSKPPAGVGLKPRASDRESVESKDSTSTELLINNNVGSVNNNLNIKKRKPLVSLDADSMNRENLSDSDYQKKLQAFTVPKLKEYLRSLELSVSGKKEELIERVVKFSSKVENVNVNNRAIDEVEEDENDYKKIKLQHRDVHLPLDMSI